MKIAIAQTEICFEEPEKNLRTAESWIEQAAQEGADAIFFPEMSFTGFSMHVEKVAAYANPIRQTMCRLAAQEHIAVGYGWTSCKPGGKGENHYTILGKSGEVLSDYVKIHPFSYGGEEQFYDSGTEIVHTVLEDFPVSTLICYDLRFPELFRAAAQTSRLIVVPANWPSKTRCMCWVSTASESSSPTPLTGRAVWQTRREICAVSAVMHRNWHL